MSKANYYEQIGVAMTCRSFNEYEGMFMLDEHLLRKGKILDVASGASSFVVELRNRGYDAIAVDPLYKLSPDDMNTLGQKELTLVTEKMAKVKNQFVWDSYKSLEYHTSIRMNSFQQFIESYRNDQIKDIYITASLPALPFEDDAFSLVLCNHFLFLYTEQFDYEFHLKAIEELIRITKKGGIIRIYPLVGFKNELSPYLEQLIMHFTNNDIKIELLSTEFRFIPTATHFLQMTK